MTIFTKAKMRLAESINERPRLMVFLVSALFFAIFFAVYFSVSTLSSGDDHFFHFRFAQQMFHNGFFSSFKNFKSIYWSRNAQGDDYFIYYNFIFYAIIIPFTFIAPLYLGIKLYAVAAAAAAFTLLYWCLQKFSIKNPLIWTFLILAITSTTSIWRFFLSRPYALAPSLLLLLLYFLYKKNHIGVFIISFAYLFWHSSTFFFPICIVVLYYLSEKFYRDKGDWKNLAAGTLGTVLAIAATYLVSSGFLLFIKDTVFSIYWDTILGRKVNINEGGELYPTDFFNFVQGNALIFSMFVTSLSIDVLSYISLKRKQISESDYMSSGRARRHLQICVLILTAGFFLGTVAASARFGDYFTFFAALYIALSFDTIRRFVRLDAPTVIKRSLAIGLSIVLIYLFASNMLFLQSRLGHGQSAFEMYVTGTWLNEHTKPGDIIFNANWSWFTQLYYYSPKDYYIEGLEPRFTYAYDKGLYWKSVHIAQDGFVCDTEKCPDLQEKRRLAFQSATSTKAWANDEGDSVAKSLINDFKASYVVTSKDYQTLDFIMSNNSHFTQELYDSSFGYLIFKISTTTQTVNK